MLTIIFIFTFQSKFIHKDVTPFSCKFEDFVKQYLQLNSLFSDNKLHLSNLFTLLQINLNQQPQREKSIPLRLQDPAESEKSEPVVKKKKINQKSKSD